MIITTDAPPSARAIAGEMLPVMQGGGPYRIGIINKEQEATHFVVADLDAALNFVDAMDSIDVTTYVVQPKDEVDGFARSEGGVAIELLCEGRPIDIALCGENGIEERETFDDIEEALDFAEVAYEHGLMPNLMLGKHAFVAAGEYFVEGSVPTLAFGCDGKIEFAVYLFDGPGGDDDYSIPLPGTHGSEVIIANPDAIYTAEGPECRFLDLDAIDADLAGDGVA